MPRGKSKFDRCVAGVTRSGSAVDPRAVCGAMRAKGTLPKEKHNQAGEEIELGAGKHFLPLSTKAHAEQMARLLRSEGAAATATQLRGAWGVLHQHSGKANPGRRAKRNRRPEIGGARLRQPKPKRDYSIRWQGHEIGNAYAESKPAALRQFRASHSGYSGKLTAVERRNPGRRRRNPLDGARERYESFHGRGSEETVEISTPIHEHSVLSGIGDLVKLVVIAENGRKVKISKFVNADGAPALLAQNEAATQLFIEGGDQSVNLRDFGIFEPYHEREVLGRVRNVYYYTRKDHLGSEGGTAIYNHKFGGVREVPKRGGGVKRVRSPLPYLVYDVRNRLLEFAGGGYTIPDEGIAN